jgi:NitT/TauT family transport system substrate-binding protein
MRERAKNLLVRRPEMKAYLSKILVASLAIGLGFSAAEAEPLKVGVIKMAALTNPWVAKKEGIFDKNGLDVSLIEFRAGSEAAAALQGGSVDIVLMIPGTAMTANERGFDIVAVFQNETAKLKGPDSGSIQVRVDSDIKSLKDLEGKKVAVSQLHSQNTVGAQLLIKNAGVDLSKVQFLELPFPVQYDSLRNKQVDAVVTVDPYTTQLQSSGVGRVISWNYVESIPEQPLGAWWVKRAFLSKNGDVVARFNKSIKESIDYMNADPDRARAQVVAYTGLDPALVKDMPLITWSYQVKPERWQQVIELMTKTGELRKTPKLDSFFAEEIKPYVQGPSQ